MLIKNHYLFVNLGFLGFITVAPWNAGVAMASEAQSASTTKSTEAVNEASTEPVKESGKGASTEAPKKESEAQGAANDPNDASAAEDIDERFSTEGYLGGYVALLQQTLPTLGFTASMYLDDDFRFGADFSRGLLKIKAGSLKTQGASVWGAWEMGDTYWLKLGMGYSRLERPTTQEPLSVLLKGEDKSAAKQEDKSDSLGVDVSFGQMWSFSKYSVSVDYVGFTLPILRLTGPKMPLYSLQAARLELLYNLD